MAGAKTAASRGRYTAAGYRQHSEAELYISDVPAGSAQDNLRDLNQLGYRAGREDTPAPVLTKPQAPRPARPEPKRKAGTMERMAIAARRDKKGAMACILLGGLILFMTAAWGGKMVDGVALARDIATYQSQIKALEDDSETLARQLELASSGERIRNLAQNELGMLRPERASHETIYIRTTDELTGTTAQESAEPRIEPLDILLGLLDVFHIGE